jgi:hypothetical protein
MNLSLPRFRNTPWVDVLALTLGVLGSISSLSLFLDVLYPRFVITVSILLTGGILVLTTKTKRVVTTIGVVDNGIIRLLIAILIGVVALLFRWAPYRFEQGGQDQGLYVNMATALARWGSVRFPDEFRQSLDIQAQAIYDQTLMLSYSLVDSTESLMTIEFYPLHPALMALAQSIFGGIGYESLTIISMLGVLCAWFLALEITGRWTVAALFTLMFAVNPALSFFAKFPVSESVALTFVMFGMLYLVRFMRANDRPQQVLYFFISLLSFNSLFYVRWQFLLYLPFLTLITFGILLLPSYRKLRFRITLFVTTVLVLFFVSMLFYKYKQPELYSPMRDAMIDMLPFSNIAMTIIGVFGPLSVIAIVVLLSRCRSVALVKKFSNVLTLERLSVYFLPLAIFLAIPSILSLYAGVPMYPWGYQVPADVDAWVIRYHAVYRLALFVSPMIFVVALFGGLRRSTGSKVIALLYLFTSLCFVGILLRPTVPYLYYYGRYLVVDILPATLLIGSITLVTWMKSTARLVRVLSWGITAISLSYCLIFSTFLLGKSEGEDAGFFSNVTEQINDNDVVLLSASYQQVLVPFRARYQINVLAVDNLSPGLSFQNIVDTFKPIANERGGRLLYLTSGDSGALGLRPIDDYTFTDRYFTNTDHFRGGEFLYLESRRRLLLPSRWQSSSTTFQLFELE